MTIMYANMFSFWYIRVLDKVKFVKLPPFREILYASKIYSISKLTPLFLVITRSLKTSSQNISTFTFTACGCRSYSTRLAVMFRSPIIFIDKQGEVHCFDCEKMCACAQQFHHHNKPYSFHVSCTYFSTSCICMYMVELHEAEKPTFAIIDTMWVNFPSAPWTDYSISLTRHGLTRAKVHSLAKWITVSGNRTAISCVANRSPWSLNHGVFCNIHIGTTWYSDHGLRLLHGLIDHRLITVRSPFNSRRFT